MKTAILDANQEVEQLRKDKENLTTEVGGLRTKTDKLESYLEQLSMKLVLKLEGMVIRLVNLSSTEVCCNIVDSLFFAMGQNFVRTLKLKPGGSRQVSTPSIVL